MTDYFIIHFWTAHAILHSIIVKTEATKLYKLITKKIFCIYINEICLQAKNRNTYSLLWHFIEGKKFAF